jgi:hypothetical protein
VTSRSSRARAVVQDERNGRWTGRDLVEAGSIASSGSGMALAAIGLEFGSQRVLAAALAQLGDLTTRQM